MNKSLEEMTPDELRALANKKEREKWVDPDKPIKEGFLKEDIYSFNEYYIDSNDFFTKKEVDRHVISFEDQFQEVLEKGTRFLCYNIDGDELWSDDVGYGIEEVDNDWAEKFLENIRDLK